MKAKSVYISGAISGVENWQENFIEAEKKLETMQFSVIVNPLAIAKQIDSIFSCSGKKPTYADYMKADIKELIKCDCICMLPNWKTSKGAKLEYRIAKALDMQIIFL